MFNSKLFNPIKQIKVRQWFVYKIEPRTGIELNGLFGPSNSPFPFPFPFPFFFFFTPIKIGFSSFRYKVVENMSNVLHHVFEQVVHKHFLYSMMVVYQLEVHFQTLFLILN